LKVLATYKLIQAQKVNPLAQEPIQGWYQIMSKTDFHSVTDLKSVFGELNNFKSTFEFPIPGTKILARTLINFSAKVVLVSELK